MDSKHEPSPEACCRARFWPSDFQRPKLNSIHDLSQQERRNAIENVNN
jgi:hypothetical protein